MVGPGSAAGHYAERCGFSGSCHALFYRFFRQFRPWMHKRTPPVFALSANIFEPPPVKTWCGFPSMIGKLKFQNVTSPLLLPGTIPRQPLRRNQCARRPNGRALQAARKRGHRYSSGASRPSLLALKTDKIGGLVLQEGCGQKFPVGEPPPPLVTAAGTPVPYTGPFVSQQDFLKFTKFPS